MEWVERIVAYSSVGIGGGAGYFFFKWLVEYLGGRMDRRAEALDKGTQQLIDNLQKQVSVLVELREGDLRRISQIEEDLQACKKLHAAADARVMQLESILQGKGDAKQYAQLLIAAEKEQNK